LKKYPEMLVEEKDEDLFDSDEEIEPYGAVFIHP